jgi:prophage regulatory protein
MKYLRDKDAAAKCAMSRQSVWRLAKTLPGFPQPVKLTAGVTVWLEHELDAWLAARTATNADTTPDQPVTDLDGIPVGPRPRRRAAPAAEFVAHHRADPLRAAKIDRAHQQISAAHDAVKLAISDQGEVLIIEGQRVIYAMPADLARRVAQLIAQEAA